MNSIIHIAPNGTIQLPPEILAQVKTDTPYEVHTENANVILAPAKKEDGAFWKTATPEQRAERFRRWADSHKPGIGLPDAAFSRESIYD